MSNVKPIIGEILRWGVIVACGGCGLWMLLSGVRGIVTSRNGSWFGLLLMLPIFILGVAPLLAVAYICLRRQYRKLFIVVGVIGSILVFGELMALPRQLGLDDYVVRRTLDKPLLGLLGLPLGILFLFGPIYAAACFYRLCQYMAYPEMRGRGTRRPKTRATGWLIWLGVFVLVLPMLGMLLLFSLRLPSTSINASLISDIELHWLVALPLLGCVLIFLGLIRRCPVPKSEKDPSLSEPE
jgi:hypothetical protein